MKSKVLGHYAETDEWVPVEQVKDMEQNMKAAGVDVTIHLYPETAHWFMETDRPEYNAEIRTTGLGTHIGVSPHLLVIPSALSA